MKLLDGDTLDEQGNRNVEHLKPQHTKAVDHSRALRGGVVDENRLRPASGGTDRLDARIVGRHVPGVYATSCRLCHSMQWRCHDQRALGLFSSPALRPTSLLPLCTRP